MNRPAPDAANHADGADAASEPSFLSRWSARKLQVRREASQAAPEPRVEPSRTAPAPALQELTDADMPSLETLDEKSDYSAFFSAKVSAELRHAALRKLFHSPAFNIGDGLTDYAEDYTRYAPLGGIITQDMRHRLEVMAQRAVERSGAGEAGHDPKLSAAREQATIISSPDVLDRRTETAPPDDELRPA